MIEFEKESQPDPNQSKPIKPRSKTKKSRLGKDQETKSQVQMSGGLIGWLHAHGNVLDLAISAFTFLVVACFGTFLLFKQNSLLESQNSLLESQNKLVKNQMYLAEADRRGALIVLMSNIMDKVDHEIENQKKSFLTKDVLNHKYTLSESLIGQIAALSHTFQPYRYIENDTLIEYPLSPERGQLFRTLLSLPIEDQTLQDIYKLSNFAWAELGGIDLSFKYLVTVPLAAGNLFEANLENSNLQNAFIPEINLTRSNMFESDLTNANLANSNLSECDLSYTNFTNANLTGVKFDDALLNYTNFTNANLRDVDFRSVYSLYECKGINDSLLKSLRISNPELFKDPYN